MPSKGTEEIFLFPTTLRLALGCEADHSPPSSAKAKNVWSCTSTPIHIFMAWYLITGKICSRQWVFGGLTIKQGNASYNQYKTDHQTPWFKSLKTVKSGTNEYYSHLKWQVMLELWVTSYQIGNT
jgi:hypothetical protein